MWCLWSGTCANTSHMIDPTHCFALRASSECVAVLLTRAVEPGLRETPHRTFKTHHMARPTVTVRNHAAIITDDAPRWAVHRSSPKTLGHIPGARRVGSILHACAAHRVPSHAPYSDLLIHTGGESRFGNVPFWQTAYTELFFADQLWSSLEAIMLDPAIDWLGSRDRRFGDSGCPSTVKG